MPSCLRVHPFLWLVALTLVFASAPIPALAQVATVTPTPPPASWYSFIPIFPGAGVSQLGLYNIAAWLSKDFDAGTTVAHYASFGEAAVNQ